MFLVSFCGLLFFLHLLQILFLQFICLSSLSLSHCERYTICFLQVVFCRVLVIFSIANVDELESYIAYNETTSHQVQECLAMVTFECQRLSWLPWKPIVRWRIETITTMKKSTHYKKCLFKLNKMIMKTNRVYWQKIDTIERSGCLSSIPCWKWQVYIRNSE
jgi:hypothetical protein